MSIAITGTDVEKFLNKRNMPELVSLLLNTQASKGFHIAVLTVEIKEINIYLKKLEVDVVVTKYVNSSVVD